MRRSALSHSSKLESVQRDERKGGQGGQAVMAVAPGTTHEPRTHLSGLWLPVPRADSAAFLEALPHTPASLVATKPRRLPNRLVRTTSLSLARSAQAPDLTAPNASSPIPNSGLNIMSRANSLPSRVPPTWHAAPHDPPPSLAHSAEPTRDTPHTYHGVGRDIAAPPYAPGPPQNRDVGLAAPSLRSATRQSASRLALLRQPHIPAMLDFSQDDRNDQHTTEGLAPGEPQCRSLPSDPDTHTTPPLQHNLDLVLNDNDARFIVS